MPQLQVEISLLWARYYLYVITLNAGTPGELYKVAKHVCFLCSLIKQTSRRADLLCDSVHSPAYCGIYLLNLEAAVCLFWNLIKLKWLY